MHTALALSVPQEFDAFLEALAPVLARLSYAFSSMALICEGSTGFQAQVCSAAGGRRPGQGVQLHCGQQQPAVLWHNPPPVCWPAHWVRMQVLCGMDRLLALGRRCGLHLQCHATASGEATAAVVGSVAAAWLARWQAADPGLHYSVADEPSEQESFLTRWVCGWLGCLAGGLAGGRAGGWVRRVGALACWRGDSRAGPVSFPMPSAATAWPAGSIPSTPTAPRCCCRWASACASCCTSTRSILCRCGQPCMRFAASQRHFTAVVAC